MRRIYARFALILFHAGSAALARVNRALVSVAPVVGHGADDFTGGRVVDAEGGAGIGVAPRTVDVRLLAEEEGSFSFMGSLVRGAGAPSNQRSSEPEIMRVEDGGSPAQLG